MIIDIQYLNTEPDWDAKRYITEKLHKFQAHYNSIKDVNVYMKNASNDRNKNKVVELKFTVQDGTLYSEARGESFRGASKEALERMERQLKKYSTKITSPHMERKAFQKGILAPEGL